MVRRALIIYCDSTASGELPGAVYDNHYFRKFLQSSLGGEWKQNEILSLRNPDSYEIAFAKQFFLNGADYTITVFSGHGCIMFGQQYFELADKKIPISSLKTTAKRQTLIVDACRGYFQFSPLRPQPVVSGFYIGDIIQSTRKMYDYAIMNTNPGWSILYASSEGQEALDTNNGGAYIVSLLTVARLWKQKDKKFNVLPLTFAHAFAKQVLYRNFDTTQLPVTNSQLKVRGNFPLFVKHTD